MGPAKKLPEIYKASISGSLLPGPIIPEVSGNSLRATSCLPVEHQTGQKSTTLMTFGAPYLPNVGGGLTLAFPIADYY